jgi:hypothetical protein
LYLQGHSPRQEAPDRSILTFQFGAVRGALPSFHNAVVVVVQQPIARQNLIQVNVIILGGVHVVPSDPGGFSQAQGYQNAGYAQLHDPVAPNQ